MTKLINQFTFKNFGKMALAGLITLGVCYSLGLWFDNLSSVMNVKLFEITKIVLIGLFCLGFYTFLNLVFKMEYAIELANRFVGKIKQKFNI